MKPGLPYLDIIRLLRDNSPLPIAAYQVLHLLIKISDINLSDGVIDEMQSWHSYSVLCFLSAILGFG